MRFYCVNDDDETSELHTVEIWYYDQEIARGNLCESMFVNDGPGRLVLRLDARIAKAFMAAVMREMMEGGEG